MEGINDIIKSKSLIGIRYEYKTLNTNKNK